MTGLQALLQRKIEALQLRQLQLARACGVSQQAVSLWMTGRAVPDTGRLPVLMEVLSISPQELAEALLSSSEQAT